MACPLMSCHAVACNASLPAEEEETAVVEASRQRGVDPEQLALLEDQFDAQDEDGDGACMLCCCCCCYEPAQPRKAMTMRLCWRAAWNMSVHMPALWTPLG